jgi:hypothetical protein
MTNKDFFKNIDKKKTKSKKTVDGYYYDGKNSFTLYKDENGKSTMKRRGKK